MFQQFPTIEGIENIDCNNGNTITYSSDYLKTCVFDKYNNTVAVKRNELDIKLEELKKTKDSMVVNDSQALYDRDMMIGVTSTILGSCILYYILHKISN
jgi:hypothetical protein